MDQVNKAVSQLDQVTQSNAAQTEELSATAESLAQQATELQAWVAKFRTGADQRQGHAPTKPAGSGKAEPKANGGAASTQSRAHSGSKTLRSSSRTAWARRRRSQTGGRFGSTG